MRCPPDCVGCYCHIAPPCGHCVEHYCPKCEDFNCDCEEELELEKLTQEEIKEILVEYGLEDKEDV